MFAISRVGVNISVNAFNPSTLRDSGSRDREHVASLNIQEYFE